MIYVVLIIVVFIVVVVVLENHYATIRSRKTGEVNDWFMTQLTHHPSLLLSPEDTNRVRSTMDDDSDLWRELDLDPDAEEREKYRQQVVNFGRFLSVFEPAGDYSPSLQYGVFGDEDDLCFWVWIEFYYQSDTAWVLTEDNDGNLSIVNFSDFRVNHPGLVHRHRIAFWQDDLD